MTGGSGTILDGEQANSLHAGLVGLQAENIGGQAEAVNFLGDVVDLDVDRAGAGRGELVIVDSLVDGADEVRASGAIAP